jgi:ATP-dependent DNA helicase
MDEETKKQAALVAERQKEGKAFKRGPPDTRASPKGKRRRGADGEAFVTEEAEAVDETVFQQPSLITGAKLKPYQLEGLQWMVSLDQNGMSGILGAYEFLQLPHTLLRLLVITHSR